MIFRHQGSRIPPRTPPMGSPPSPQTPPSPENHYDHRLYLHHSYPYVCLYLFEFIFHSISIFTMLILISTFIFTILILIYIFIFSSFISILTMVILSSVQLSHPGLRGLCRDIPTLAPFSSSFTSLSFPVLSLVLS